MRDGGRPDGRRGEVRLDRPLPLGEAIAATVAVYRSRLPAALGLGVIVAVAFALAAQLPDAFAIALLAFVFTAAYALAALLAAGVGFADAWRRLAARAAPLSVLTLVVSVPFAIGVFIRAADPLAGLVFILFAVCWLVFLGFAIPLTVERAEPEEGSPAGLVRGLAATLQRSVALARTEFLHAVGVVAALLIVYGLLGPFMAAALVGFAENSVEVAFTISQVVLAPFFFLGLAVLFFEQSARARLAARAR